MTEIEKRPPYKLPTFHNWTPQATFYHPLQAGSIDGTDLFPHDKGVLRAMLSRYKPNKSITGEPNKTVFVARLSKDTSQDTIQNIFENFGEIQNCQLVRDFVTGFSKGFAFVEFKRKRDALTAASETHKMNIDGREILVDLECEHSLDGWKPRRLGGGFGGWKESGQLRFGGIDRPFKRPLPSQVEHFPREPEREFRSDRSSRKVSERGGYKRERRDREDHRDRGDRKSREDHRDRWDRRDREDHRDRGDHKDREDHRGRGDHRDREDHRDGEDHRDREDHRDGEDHKDREDNRDREDHRGREDHRDREDRRDRKRDKDRDVDRGKWQRDRYTEDTRRSTVEFADHHHSPKEPSRSRDRAEGRSKEDRQDNERS